MRGNVDVAPAPQSGRANTAVHQALRKAIDVFNAERVIRACIERRLATPSRKTLG